MGFWRRLFGIRQPLYLGSITVASSFSLKKGLAKLAPVHNPVDPGVIEQTLRDIMALPPASSRMEPGSNDMAIDITVSDFDVGEFMFVPWIPVSVPLAWRPQISMTARVYRIDSGQDVYAHTVHQKLQWKIWLRRLRNPMAFFRMESYAKAEDLEYLVRRTCIKLLRRVQKQI